jgi:hypothetical protein
MKTHRFSPLIFLSSLGAGGIAVMPFVLFQYTIEHGKGLITYAQLWMQKWNVFTSVYFTSLEGVMIFFTVLHLLLTVYLFIQLFSWMQTQEFREMMRNPLKNTALLTPLISLLMTMNVFIGPIRYFSPLLSANLQSLFLPALIVWAVIYILSLGLEIHMLSMSFIEGFDIDKIHFGWLLHPFLLSMLSVVGAGIAAMSTQASIAHTASFMVLISVSMGVFLLLIKIVTLFKKHFASSGLPEKQLLPSVLVVIPNITLFAITFFRLGHYLEKFHHLHLGAYFYFVIGLAFAFEIWYLLFGIYLLWDYFQKHHFRDYYLTQWGFICPFVAFVVLGAFAYSTVAQSALLYGMLVVGMIVAIGLYGELAYKHVMCTFGLRKDIHCELQ